MATIAQHQQPTPERFFNAINAYEQTEAMKAAIELEIFTAIAEGNATAATIAKRCEAAERGVRTLCDFLTIHGFLTKEGAQYALAPDSALFLNRHSPAYIGTAIEFLRQNRIPPHTSMQPIGRMCLRSQGRMRRQWELPIATTCFPAAPSKPILATATIWR